MQPCSGCPSTQLAEHCVQCSVQRGFVQCLCVGISGNVVRYALASDAVQVLMVGLVEAARAVYLLHQGMLHYSSGTALAS